MFTEFARLVAADCVAPDLPGHGGRGSNGTAWNEAVVEVAGAIAEHQPDVVVGYSLGGRLALGAALAAPHLVESMVLVSTSLGIDDPADRMARHHKDWRLAESIERDGVADFIERWNQDPILSAHGTTLDLATIRASGTASGLAAALRGMGQGEQPPLRREVPKLKFPITWMAGSRDRKYVAMATEAAALSPLGTVEIVDGALHNVVAQRPDAVAAVVQRHLDGGR